MDIQGKVKRAESRVQMKFMLEINRTVFILIARQVGEMDGVEDNFYKGNRYQLR